MPPRIELLDVSGRIGDLGGGVNSLSNKVEIVKVTSGTFIKDKNSDIWVEIVLGNDTDEQIMITDLVIQTDSSIYNMERGVSKQLSNSSSKKPLYYEDDSMPTHPNSNNGGENGWNTMYKDSVLLPNDHPYFEKGTIDSCVKAFLYTLDGEKTQRIVTTPVNVTANNIEGNKHHCTGFDTETGEGEPILWPKDTVGNKIEENNSEFDEYVDTISFWIKCNTNNVPRYDGDGEFIFDLQTESQLDSISHTYHYYITPTGATFGDTRGTPKVDFWDPADKRTLFDQWASDYNVKEATTTGTDSSREILRNEEGVRNEKSVTTKGDFNIHEVQNLDRAFIAYFGIVLAIFGGKLISALNGGNLVESIFIVLGVFIFLFVVVIVLYLNIKNKVVVMCWSYLKDILQ